MTYVNPQTAHAYIHHPSIFTTFFQISDFNRNRL